MLTAATVPHKPAICCITCPGFNIKSLNLKKTINLFCNQQPQNVNPIEGEISEYNVPNKDNIQFKVVTQDNHVYLVLVSKQILNQMQINPTDALDKSVRIKDVKPRKLAGDTWEVKITQLNQLFLLKQ